MPISDTNVVSDFFWLNLGAEEVYNSIQNRRDSIDRLQKAIGWVFGIFTSITIGSILFTKKEDWHPVALLLFGVSFLFLIWAYWKSTVASFPESASIYAGAPVSIQEAFNARVVKNNETFKSAVILTSIGVLFYSIALFVQFASPSISKYFKAMENNSTNDSLDIKKMKVTNNENLISLQIFSKKNSWNNVSVMWDTIKNNKIIEDTININKGGTEKTVWIYIDSTATQHIYLDYNDKPNTIITVGRTDTIKITEKSMKIISFRYVLK